MYGVAYTYKGHSKLNDIKNIKTAKDILNLKLPLCPTWEMAGIDKISIITASKLTMSPKMTI
jgi:hypothetical protein